MARNPAFSMVQRALSRALTPASGSGPEVRSAPRVQLGRRQALRAGFTGLACAALGVNTSACLSGARAHVAIIGAGIAGLTCAYRLQQAGIAALVFDAAKRVGGRMHTARGALADGQIAELGGELIDTGHSTMHRLAQELGIQLDDLSTYTQGLTDTFYFAGMKLSESSLARAFVPVAARMQRDLAAADSDPATFTRLDAMSMDEWLDSVPDLDTALRATLTVAYIGEYGRELSEQSVFNLLWLIDSVTPDPFRVFGDSDERFHARGGNDQFVTRLADSLAREVELEQRLVRIQQRRNGRLRLAFTNARRTIEQDFEHVVLALPWTLLREVELELELPAPKRRMIAELGYGQNTKHMLQFSDRLWRDRYHASGVGFADTAAQTFWDTSRGQAGASGIVTVFLGGERSLASGAGAPEQQAEQLLTGLEPMFGGITQRYRAGSALRMHWPTAPWVRGSYACYLPGQAAWSGTEGEAVDNLHFCGEHTSEEFQGYMEGAAQSGERAAEEVIAAAAALV